MSIWIWLGFSFLLLALLAIDLGVLNRRAHIISAGEALRQWAVWVGCALLFTVGLYFLYDRHVGGLGVAIPQVDKTVRDVGGWEAAQLFLTGYLVEASLSMDNMLVIALILQYFCVPREHQHRVLFWGIIGAVVLRGAMIVAGAALLARAHWLIYVFGVVLLASAGKLLLMKGEAEEIGHSFAVRAARRLFRVSPDYDGARFFTRRDGVLMATPLLLALAVVDIADVVFAIDSIPAIFGITLDPFIVFTSNCFAILGLRAIYFAIAAMIDTFRYMKASMVFVLGFIGLKMLLPLGPPTVNAAWRLICSVTEREYAPVYSPTLHLDIPPTFSLGVIAGILLTGLLASMVIRPRMPTAAPETGADELVEMAEQVVRNSRKIVIAVIGVTVLLLAIPIGLIPGPGGIFVALAGVAILATEFVWARRLLKRAKKESSAIMRKVKGMVGIESAPAAEPQEDEKSGREQSTGADRKR